jgi:hypothetical protein
VSAGFIAIPMPLLPSIKLRRDGEIHEELHPCALAT